MAKWAPAKDKIEPKEPIGRRLFDEPLLFGASDQPNFQGLRVTHFEETRGDEISVDRLGRTGIEGKVTSFLKPLALKASQSFSKPKTFQGWVWITAGELAKQRKDFRSYVVMASPIDDVTNLNPYHAHIKRPADQTSMDAALQLRHLYATYGKIEKVSVEKRLGFFSHLVMRVRGFFSANKDGRDHK